MPTVYFHYINLENKGRIAIAYKYSIEDELLYMGFAFCSPNDRFIKAKAREISSSRLENPTSCHNIYVPNDKGRCPKRSELIAIMYMELDKFLIAKCYADIRRRMKFPHWFNDKTFVEVEPGHNMDQLLAKQIESLPLLFEKILDKYNS